MQLFAESFEVKSQKDEVANSYCEYLKVFYHLYFDYNYLYNIQKVILLSMILRNTAYEPIDGTGRHQLSEEYENSVMELVDVTSKSNVIEIKRLKCGRRLTVHPQFSNEATKALVFHSPGYEKKPKYSKKVKYV